MATAFEKLKAKSVGASSSPSASLNTFSPQQNPESTGSAFERLKMKGAVPTQAPVPEEKGSAVGGFLKSVVAAPATLIARPFQAAADFGDYLGTEMAAKGESDAVQAAIYDDRAKRLEEKQGKSTFGGIVAPTPANAGDVVKDVGRGIQTVAMGTTAPLAGGAAFGLGASLENQGGDILSKEGLTDALVSTLVGMGAGKALDLVGKPLLNVAGKVIGTITPKTLQDVASKGSQAVSNFMAHHEIVPAATKPAINAIPKVAQQFDEGVNKLFKGAGTAVSNVAKSQYPGAKEAGQKHFEKIEVNRLFEPTKKSDAGYKNARAIYDQAKQRGINLEEIAANNKIYGMDNIDEGKFFTEDTINTLRDEAISGGKEFLRPALKAAEPGVQRVPLSQVRNEMLERVAKAPSSVFSPEQKAKFAKEIMKEYADDSITGKLYKDGLALTDLYDSKLQTVSGVYKKQKGGVASISDALTQQKKRIESQVFDDIFRRTAPPELRLDEYFKAQEGRFMLADYLESLNTRKAPLSLFQRSVRRASQLAGATTGANVAGPFGMFSGYQFGGIAADTFASLPNPVKIAYLNSIGMKQPEIYAVLKQFTKDVAEAATGRTLLNAPQTIYVPPTQGGKPYTPNNPPDQSSAVGGIRQRKNIKDFYQ